MKPLVEPWDETLANLRAALDESLREYWDSLPEITRLQLAVYYRVDYHAVIWISALLVDWRAGNSTPADYLPEQET